MNPKAVGRVSSFVDLNSDLQIAGANVGENPADRGTEANALSLRRSAQLDEAYEQYCQLLERGEAVDTEEFCRGYPGLELILQRQIEVHRLIEDQPSLLRECFEVAWPRPGHHVAGFRLIEELGRGAFSRVFRAEDTCLGNRQVAIKVCHDGAHEAWILGKLTHENIVPVHSIQHDAESGLSLICMPYLGCTTLRDVIASVWQSATVPVRASAILEAGREQDSPLLRMMEDAPRVLRRGAYIEGVVFIGLKIAEALVHAHSEGILHLDLKPSNVLMDDRGCPRLLDFNLASDASQGIPRMGGTLPYMSPEQARCFLDGDSGADFDERSDIFSLGVVMYEMLCGELPYGGVSHRLSSREAVRSLFEQQTRGRKVTDWQRFGVSNRLSAIIERCLALDPHDRYESAEALAADLQRELSVVRQARRWVRSHRRLAVGVLGAAIIVGASIAAGLASRDPYPLREFKSGVACLESGELKESAEHFTHSINADPQQPEALYLRACAFVKLGSFHEAIRDLNDADRLKRDGKQCALMGYCCNRVNSYGDAVGWYERAISHGYSTTAVFNNLGYSYFWDGRHDLALQKLNVAIEMGDRPWVTLYNRAIVWHAVAVANASPPTDAMHDIDSALSLGHCTAEKYYCAATVYGYASSFGDSWKNEAIKYMGMALEHGTPLSSFKSDIFLAPLLQDPTLADKTWETDEAASSLEGHHFIDPLE